MWYIISAVAAAVLILIFSRIPKRVLNKLEPIALMGILIGLLYLFTDPIKNFINRARFREMVAFSHGIPDAKDPVPLQEILWNRQTTVVLHRGIGKVSAEQC